MGFQTETAEQYERWTRWFRADPKREKAMCTVNKALTALGYVAYFLLLILSVAFNWSQNWLQNWSQLGFFIVVPAVGFLICSLVRVALNRPRPYEVLEIQPLIEKDTRGKSFPSRHSFSMFAIALSWLWWLPAVGVPLVLCACLLAILRVLGGVHFPKDVIAGAILAIVVCAIGYSVLGIC